jgi:MYXO-CTERM domain-containing protein
MLRKILVTVSMMSCLSVAGPAVAQPSEGEGEGEGEGEAPPVPVPDEVEAACAHIVSCIPDADAATCEQDFAAPLARIASVDHEACDAVEVKVNAYLACLATAECTGIEEGTACETEIAALNEAGEGAGGFCFNGLAPVEGWACNGGYYSDGEFCDCGCGVADPDCDGAGVATGGGGVGVEGCEYCYGADGEALEGRAGQCLPPPPEGWLCDEAVYDDGFECDCGCGVADPDCDGAGTVTPGEGVGVEGCNVCNGADGQPLEGNAGRCLPPPPEGWNCSESFYGADDGCDCGCGIADPDCGDGGTGTAGEGEGVDGCEFCYGEDGQMLEGDAARCGNVDGEEGEGEGGDDDGEDDGEDGEDDSDDDEDDATAGEGEGEDDDDDEAGGTTISLCASTQSTLSPAFAALGVALLGLRRRRR